MMKEILRKSEQRGTLLVEALAMLGLIAMVTPTLYKKSADRLTEINDINVASQARTMANVMDTFVRRNYSGLMSSTAEVSNSTVVIEFDDNASGSGVFDVGYSSFLPYGYQPDELRGYDSPKIYVHRDDSTLVYYVLYPKIVDPGNRRAARMASLVGSNGGVITDTKEAKGTGGAWYLDSTMVNELDIDPTALTENSLMITAEEPITMSYDDNARYLYRVPPDKDDDDSEYYHNTMVTDIYMGGHTENTDFGNRANDYYSIYNVRRMTMNTNCNRYFIGNDTVSSTAGGYCDPDVADLYIGKPFSLTGHGTLNDGEYSKIKGNTGAAWIYGNLAALNDSFQLFRETDLYQSDFHDNDGYDTDMNRMTSAYDVLQFARMNSTGTGDEEMIIFRAENEEDGGRVALMDEFVQVREATGGSTGAGGISADGIEFLVGNSSSAGGEGAFIHAFSDGADNYVMINSSITSPLTYINPQGGTVFINGGSTGANMTTHINDNGGIMDAGYKGGWMMAQGREGSSRVHLLPNYAGMSGNDNRIFTIGHQVADNGSVSDPYDIDHIMYADSSKVSLRGGNIRSYSVAKAHLDDDGGPTAFLPTDSEISSEYTALQGKQLTGLTTIASRYTDILGPTYIGIDNMDSTDADDGEYTRGEYRLGVAGSAWVDGLLWARQAWLHDAGVRELHAGFDNFMQYKHSSKTAWLNVYDDKVIIRNRSKNGSPTGEGEVNVGMNDVMLWADSQKIVLGDTHLTSGAWAWLEGGSARIGTNENFFFADRADTGEGSANVVGSTLVNLYTYNDDISSVVDVQNEAMRFAGHWDSSYANRIDAKTGIFTLKTKDVSSTDQNEGAQFYADKDLIRMRWVDFQVEDDSSTVRFKVAPNSVPDSKTDEANVQVDGSFHVTGNEVIHIASNSSNAVGTEGNEHAMFEIDPEYVQIWAKDEAGNYAGGSSGSDYYAMLRINPHDVQGSTSVLDDVDDASIYIRKGAIELMESQANGSSGASADSGFGYIKANRFVSNAGQTVPSITDAGSAATNYIYGSNPYDQYMVNPAYTSVMHDIKLTTRGGARLSDILPDFVLKGVYNISNDFVEGGNRKKRIDWSCGSLCTDGPYTPAGYDIGWADSYVGKIPYAICPPGYRNMATIVPVSFNIGQAGEVITPQDLTHIHSEVGAPAGKWIINPATRQAKILAQATQDGAKIIYPKYEEVSSLVYNGLLETPDAHPGFENQTISRTEGWYLGLKPDYKDSAHTETDAVMKGGVTGADTSDGDNVAIYNYFPEGESGQQYVVAQPLYFQQNTWLKASVKPNTVDEDGWDGYLGFIYDKNYYGAGVLGDGLGGEGIVSNNTDGTGNAEGSVPMVGGNYVWNLFPVPTNTLEGHATVYCYFDRTQFKSGDWGNLVDQIDQLGDFRPIKDKTDGGLDTGLNTGYTKRLNDPTLRYDDPW